MATTQQLSRGEMIEDARDTEADEKDQERRKKFIKELPKWLALYKDEIDTDFQNLPELVEFIYEHKWLPDRLDDERTGRV